MSHLKHICVNGCMSTFSTLISDHGFLVHQSLNSFLKSRFWNKISTGLYSLNLSFWNNILRGLDLILLTWLLAFLDKTQSDFGFKRFHLEGSHKLILELRLQIRSSLSFVWFFFFFFLSFFGYSRVFYFENPHFFIFAIFLKKKKPLGIPSLLQIFLISC